MAAFHYLDYLNRFSVMNEQLIDMICRRFFRPSILLALCLDVCFADVNGAAVEVMSFNIRNGNANDGENRWDLRKDFVYELIRDASPDVLGLQEAVRFQLDGLKGFMPDYGEIGIVSDSARHTGQYTAILYLKKRFEADASGTFWLSDTPETPSAHWGNHHLRICTWARLIDRDTGQAFYVYNTHLDDGSQVSREKAAQLLMHHYQGQAVPGPLVLMGDFNVGEDNSVISYLTGAGELAGSATPVSLFDTFRVLHPDEVLVGTFSRFDVKRVNGAKIDYILVSPGFRTLAAGILRVSRDGRTPSDHFPVTARLSF